jgi:hypothetical protein
MPNGMYQSAGGNARFRSIPKSVSKFEIIERSIDDASKQFDYFSNIYFIEKKLMNMQGEEYSNKVRTNYSAYKFQSLSFF